MPGDDDVYAEPQQYTVSVWRVIAIANPSVMVLNIEAVQLKHELAVRHQALILGAPIIGLAAQKLLIPSAACFDVSSGLKLSHFHHSQGSHSVGKFAFAHTTPSAGVQ